MKGRVPVIVRTMKSEYDSPDVKRLNLPVIRRPDDEQIRQYVKDHEDQFSLTDFADWIIKNSHK